jgi:hypothetical protein
MSPAAAARQKRTETRGDAWCTRPAELPNNAHVPKYGWLVQHALYMSTAVVLKTIWSLRPDPMRDKQGRQRGAVLADASITRIARATARFTNPLSDAPGEPMPRRTVAHCLEALAQKGFIQRFDTERAKTSPAGTSWLIRRFDDILQTWADDPNIGTVGNRAFYVIGKGRRHMTPGELAAWNITGSTAPANPRAHAAGTELPEPAIEPAAPAPAALDFEPLIAALIDVSGRATEKDAAWLWTTVEKWAGNGELPSVDVVAAQVRRMYATRRGHGQQAPMGHGLIEKQIAGYLESWRRYRSKELAGAAVAARFEQENRVRTLAGYMAQLAQADLPPPDEAALMAEVLDAASAEDLEAARKLLARN